MSEMNPDDAINVEFEERSSSSMPPKRHNKKPGFLRKAGKVVVTGALCFGCGVAGGVLAVGNAGSSSGSTTTVTTSAAKPTSKVTTVSSNDSSTGLTTSEVATKAAPSVVEILTEGTSTTYGMFGGTYTTQSAGSGVIISEDGYIITNHHVIEDANKITITTYDGTSYDATLVGSDEKADIAVLKVDAEGLTPATIGDSSLVQVGDTAVVIGNPLGTLGGTVTDGIISATSREVTINNEAMELLQTNAQINSGNSGGGLFDGNGNLIGIVNAKDSGTTSSGTTIEGLGFAIPINTAFDVATQIMENGHVTNRATIGVYLQELTQNSGRYTAGLYITDVIDGSGADKAGLKQYDRIVKANGKDISSYSDLSAALIGKNVGDDLDMTIERNGKQIDVTVTLTGTLDSDD